MWSYLFIMGQHIVDGSLLHVKNIKYENLSRMSNEKKMVVHLPENIYGTYIEYIWNLHLWSNRYIHRLHIHHISLTLLCELVLVIIEQMTVLATPDALLIQWMAQCNQNIWLI